MSDPKLAELTTDHGFRQKVGAVLDDLARFCYVNRSTSASNAIAMAVAEGRRQVWLHIQHKLNLTDAQVDRIAYQPENPDD